MKKNVLVIGGAGYIGSHMVRMLQEEGYNPVIFDNLSTGHRRFIPKGCLFIKGDLRDERDVQKAFAKIQIHSVIHFSASSLVSESVVNPLKYYDNNVGAFITLLRVMKERRVTRIIFSSTAATYGEPAKIPILENAPQRPVNPYGRSKLMMERIISDAALADKDISFVVLRYFNVAGASQDASVGEYHDPETHLIPNLLKAVKGRQKVFIYGHKYPTRDGSCVRDYIHVQDLCEAHLLALKKIERGVTRDFFNLGTERGYSNFEIVKMVEDVTGGKVDFKIGAPRPGDPATLVASSAKARRVLGWKPKRDLKNIIQTAWNWEKKLGV
jgi:UDP-glucose 4-epimerase